MFEIIQNLRSEKFERELLILKDGGTAGVDWSVNDDGIGKPPPGDTKPILLLYPGLSGGN